MSTVIHPPIHLPAEREVQLASEGQRALTAYLCTQIETQRIQIFDERNEAHSVELPTSALRLLVDILAELAAGNAVKVDLPKRRGTNRNRNVARCELFDSALAFGRSVSAEDFRDGKQ